MLSAIGSPLSVFAATKPEKMPPQPGDRLVHAFGDKAGQVIQNAAVKLNAAPLEAYPKYVAENSADSILRDRSRLNMVLVMRLASESLSETMVKTLPENAAEGLIAYSAVCTHTGCTVEGWDAENKHLICPCHGSKYDAANSATVLNGPASKPLATLPLRIEAGEIVVAGEFSRKVGFEKL